MAAFGDSILHSKRLKWGALLPETPTHGRLKPLHRKLPPPIQLILASGGPFWRKAICGFGEVLFQPYDNA